MGVSIVGVSIVGVRIVGVSIVGVSIVGVSIVGVSIVVQSAEKGSVVEYPCTSGLGISEVRFSPNREASLDAGEPVYTGMQV